MDQSTPVDFNSNSPGFVAQLLNIDKINDSFIAVSGEMTRRTEYNSEINFT